MFVSVIVVQHPLPHSFNIQLLHHPNVEFSQLPLCMWPTH